MTSFRCLKGETDEEDLAGGKGHDCDLNGNFYVPDDPKSCVLQILPDSFRQCPQTDHTLPFSESKGAVENQFEHHRRPVSSTRLNISTSSAKGRRSSTSVVQLVNGNCESDSEPENEDFELENETEDDPDDDHCVTTSQSRGCRHTESSISFNPGDVLSSPIPPLARIAASRSRSRTIIPATSTFNSNSAVRVACVNETTTRMRAPKTSDQPGSKLTHSFSNFPSLQQLISTPSIHSQIKQCHLSTVLGSARRCIRQLHFVKDGLASIASADKQLSKGKKAPKTEGGSKVGPDYALIATLGEHILTLTRSAFTPAHRLYTSALGLHMAEDLIRNPTDPALLNFKAGHIVRPSWNSIIHTQMKLRFCVDSATEAYHQFGRDVQAHNNNCNNGNNNNHNNKSASNSSLGKKSAGSGTDKMQQIMVTLMHAFQDLYATALGSNDIFKVLLHIEDYGESVLQQFLLSLESTERSELLAQVQNLRRSFDDIVISMEKLSWAAYVVFRLASGKSLTPSPDASIPPSEKSSQDGYEIPVVPSIPVPPSSSRSSSSSHRVKGQSRSHRDRTGADEKNGGSKNSNSGKNYGTTGVKEKVSKESTTSAGKKAGSSSSGGNVRPSSSSSSRSQNQRDRDGSNSNTSSGRNHPQNSSNSSIKSKSGKGQTDSSGVRSSESRTISRVRSSEKREADDANSEGEKNGRSRPRSQPQQLGSQSSKGGGGSHRSGERKSYIPTPTPGSRKTSPNHPRTSKGSSGVSNRGSSTTSSYSSTVSSKDTVRVIPGSLDKDKDKDKDRERSRSDQKAETSRKHSKSKSRSSSRDSRTSVIRTRDPDPDTDQDQEDEDSDHRHHHHRSSSSRPATASGKLESQSTAGKSEGRYEQTGGSRSSGHKKTSHRQVKE